VAQASVRHSARLALPAHCLYGAKAEATPWCRVSPCCCPCRFKFLWHDVVLVTDPAALATIMGRGEHAVDKAFETYAPINKMCDPHGQVRRSVCQHRVSSSTPAQVLRLHKQKQGRICILSAPTGRQHGVRVQDRVSVMHGCLLTPSLAAVVCVRVVVAQPADSSS
jgi:hypothetical protein